MNRPSSLVPPLLMCILLLNTHLAWTKEPSDSLHIEIQEHGVARILAQVKLHASPEQAFAILTDYEQWPALFPEGFQIDLTPCSDHCTVMADMLIPHALVSRSTHLRAKSIEASPHSFTLYLIEGDYIQYQLKWDFASAESPDQTQATVSFVLQPKAALIQWVPDFLYKWTLRKGLEEHFDKVQQQVETRSSTSSPTKP